MLVYIDEDLRPSTKSSDLGNSSSLNCAIGVTKKANN